MRTPMAIFVAFTQYESLSPATIQSKGFLLDHIETLKLSA